MKILYFSLDYQTEREANFVRRMKKLLSALLCAALLAGLLPGAVLAAGGTADWASEAVTKLNQIYGSDGTTSPFSDSMDAMKESDVQTILTATGWETDKISNSDESTENNNLTRSTACAVLADVFDLPVPSGTSAIEYLYDQNIINGKADGNLDTEGSVSKAEFAVLTYRVLNSVGGGKGTAVEGLNPGTPEYVAWMYLAVRKCVPFVEGEEKTPINVNQQIGTAENIETYVVAQPKSEGSTIFNVITAPKNGKDIWDAWEDALGNTNIGGIENFVATGYDADDTLLEAAAKIVGQFMELKSDKKDLIFHDVTPDSWFYDGIMYLANQNIVIGYGDGQFGPNDTLPRFQFAVLLSIMDGTIESTDTSPDRIYKAVQNVVNKGYMLGTNPTDENWEFSSDSEWGAATKTTREEAVRGILAMIKQKYSIETTSANTAILDRFTDKDQISNDFEPFLAYAISMGLLSGTSENTLSPKAPVSRAQVGVLAYRTLIGLDKSKMKDYADSVKYAMPENAPATVSAFSSIATLSSPNTLTLREDWRLTGELDLNVPADSTLTIQGNGYHIYEMGGQTDSILNPGAGTVTFAEGTILYPAADDENAKKITPEGIWDTKESNALMALRAGGYTVKISNTTNGTVTVDKLAAKAGDTVTLTVTPNSGYTLDTLKVTYGSETPDVEISNYTFTMPAGDVTITATFKAKPAAPTFSPAGGTYTSSQSVTISAAEGATIYYTTDSSEPTTSSTQYNNNTPITISSTTTLKAVAVAADGTSSDVATATYTIRTGGGGGGGGGGSSTTTETTTNPDGSTTTTVTNNITGTVTETTKNPDGSTEVVETKKDGTVTTTNTDTEGNKTKVVETPDGTTETTMDRTDGSRSVTTVDENGIVVSETSLTTAAIETAAAAGQPAALPLAPLPLTADQETAPTVAIDLPAGTSARVEIPVESVTLGTIVVVVGEDGTETVVKTTVATENGVAVTLSDGDTVKIVDNSKEFDDVSDTYWGADSVTFASSRELFNGTSATTFSPEAPMTRAMIVTVLARYDGVDTDTGTTWYDAGVQWAVAAGVSDGTGLDQNLTREQLATMLWRYAGEPVPSASLDAYGDASSVSSYAQQAMAWAVETGLFQGVTPDTLRPQGQAIRAQVATILMRFIETSA